LGRGKQIHDAISGRPGNKIGKISLVEYNIETNNLQRDSKYRWSKIKKDGQGYSFMIEKFGIGILLALPRGELEADGIRIAKWTWELIGGLADSLKG
jgi:hypothetical protein